MFTREKAKKNIFETANQITAKKEIELFYYWKNKSVGHVTLIKR